MSASPESHSLTTKEQLDDERSEELKARDLAEDSREKTWRGNSFMKELFLGRLRMDLMDPFPAEKPTRPEFKSFYAELKAFLAEHVDAAEIDRTGEYPQHVVDGLRKLGAFGMKIPASYGGLGLTHPEYVETMKLLGSSCANVTALLSAHQAIGVPQPVKLFGTEDMRKEYLPRCAKGAISAFALTEPSVGSDPGRLATVAELSDDGEHYILNGEKLWCTNGTLAELLVVMARNPETNRINAYVVETEWEGVTVDHRCHFMGLKALANAVVSFKDVKVPVRNRIGKEGDGLKIALVTLNTGRLSLPAATSGGIKLSLEIVRKWCNARVQWGVPVGKHEAIAHKLADMAATAFAMEAVAELVGHLADRPNTDIRLEAAAAKEWNTTRAWKFVDETLQIRGGRGYETETSLASRGEPAIGIERMMRDSRINLIFEGSSEIMHLFMAREAVDKHLQVAGAMVDPRSSLGAKLAALPKVGLFYAWWYPTRWMGWGHFPRYGQYGKLAGHVRFANRKARKLAREIFHGMMVYQAGMERKQMFLFRAVDIATELFAMSTAIAKAKQMKAMGMEGAESAERLADLFARNTRRNVNRLFHELWSNDDALKHRIGKEVLEGKHMWLEQGTAGLPYTIEDLTPPSMDQILARRQASPKLVAEADVETRIPEHAGAAISGDEPIGS